MLCKKLIGILFIRYAYQLTVWIISHAFDLEIGSGGRSYTNTGICTCTYIHAENLKLLANRTISPQPTGNLGELSH